MSPVLIAIGILLVIVLAALMGYWVGTLMGTSAAESRVVEYINSHPSRQMFRMADRLYAEKRFLYAEPWGSCPEKPERVTRCTAHHCRFPDCDCAANMIPHNDDQQLFV